MIAALYVEKGGVYYGLPDVDPWDEERDARLYEGPWPVVAHPPCARWGNYWYGSPSSPKRLEMGDDGGCFEAALRAVQRFGGVLEHPAGSRAWGTFQIAVPPPAGGWVAAGLYAPGWTCCVEQGHYGHRARKATWLYYVPPAAWSRCPDCEDWMCRLHGTHAFECACRPVHEWDPGSPYVGSGTPPNLIAGPANVDAPSRGMVEMMTKPERARTPLPFRDLLLEIARTAPTS